MKSKLLPVLLACACVSVARADFNPVAITPGSYTLGIVVPATTLQGLPENINVTAGGGSAKTDNSFFEQGLYITRAGARIPGIPIHDSVFTSISNANMSFQMPPAFPANNTLMIDASFTSGTMTFLTPTTATNLAVLSTSGGGSCTVHYIVTHADTTTESGTLSLLDWFTGGPTVAWAANGRVNSGGGYSNINTNQANQGPPYFYANQITVSGASPVVSVEFDTASGNHANILAISGNASGPTWTPMPVDGASYNVKAIVPTTTFPVTGTMDRGTNINSANGMNTWFEQGFFRQLPASGLPPSGTTFDSVSQPTHHYTFGSYTGNNAILIDTNHQSATIGLVTPAAYTGLAFLTAGGGEGAGNTMTNVCIIQHQDGVNETNVFLGFDWFDTGHNGALAFQSNGRVDMRSRAVNSFTDSRLFPYLFETYFVLSDSTSPVTNIVVKYSLAPNATCTTFVMAISGTTEGIPALVTSGPTPSSQTVVPGTNVTFNVGVTGTLPTGGYWQVEQPDGSFLPLTDGLDANGSTISGSRTFTLSISNVYVADGTNYQFVAGNAYGTNISPNGLLTVTPQTVSISPVNPSVSTHNDVPLTATVTAGPALQYQWFTIDLSAVSNVIANATNSTYTIPNVSTSMSGYTFGVTVWNVYGTNTAMTTLTVNDNAATLVGDLSPTNAEAYVGAQVTYAVNTSGNTPIYYQWTTNGVVVTGLNSNRFTLTTPCGLTTVQVSFSNALSGGVMVNSSAVQLQGDGNPQTLGFNTSGTGWKTNGTLAGITNNTLLLTDGAGGETSSAFYTVAQYVGGAWNASFIYNSHGGGADGTAFVLQTTNPAAIGGGGGQLGYTGIAGNTLAYEINLYTGNPLGATLATNGATGGYLPTTPVSLTTTNDILVNLSWNAGVMTVTLTDQHTLATYTTNYNVGSLSALLGGNLAYVGFTGADGGVASTQTVKNFQFHSVLPPVGLSVSPMTGTSFVISWPNADPTYVLQTNSSLTGAWAAGPTPVTANGTNQVTVNVSGNPQVFYRLQRIACP
jgi:hypothetical protein